MGLHLQYADNGDRQLSQTRQHGLVNIAKNQHVFATVVSHHCLDSGVVYDPLFHCRHNGRDRTERDSESRSWNTIV